MIRALVVSDSHGDIPSLLAVLRMHREAEAVFFLGDGASDFFSPSVARLCMDKKITAVCGNCDFGSVLPKEELTVLQNIRILALHGHTRHAKYGLGEMQTAAEEEYQASVVLYGHTHHPSVERVNGVCYFCPGSIRAGEYGMLDITDKGEIACITARL